MAFCCTPFPSEKPWPPFRWFALCATAYPSMPITVTTMTPTGSERAMSAFGKDVHHVYLPYDLPGAMNRFLNTVQPKLVIVMETEAMAEYGGRAA